MSLKELILAAEDLPREPVTIPEWKDAEGKPLTLYIRTLTGTDRDAYEQSLYDPQAKKAVRENIRARLVAVCLVDESGARVFSDADAAALGAKSGAVLVRLWEAARHVNAMDIKDEENLEKNSGAGRSAGSTSTLPSASA